MNTPINWGILGTGSIAEKFAYGLSFVPHAKLVAVGSRSSESAQIFGQKFGIPKRFGSYERLARESDVEIVYVATPHSQHADNSLLLLQEGKAVLCEKPFTINSLEAERVITLARRKELFLMEAMWTRFLPSIAKVRKLIDEGAIGDIQMVNAGFGFRAAYDPGHRLFDPSLGGGALLDVGIYSVSLSSMTLGYPKNIISSVHLGETGVDEQGAIVLGYEQGKMAVLTMAIRAELPQEAYIVGTKGRICIHSPWWKSKRITLLVGKREEAYDFSFEGNGLNYEAEEVMKCLREGKRESDIMPLNETLAVMKILDQIRALWGLKYPME